MSMPKTLPLGFYISDAAQTHLKALLADQEVDGMTIRIFIEDAGTVRAEPRLAYCPPGAEQASDVMLKYDQLSLYFDQRSLSHLQDTTIDMQPMEGGDKLTMKAPHAKERMKPAQHLTLSSYCQAQRVPQGDPVVLPEGAQVMITQALGGSISVIYEGNLYRLADEEVCRLGLQEKTANYIPNENGQIDEDHCWEAMCQVYDPEIPVNIVSLGLVYALNIDQASHSVNIVMTLTSASCGMGDVIVGDVRNKLLEVPFVEDCQVEIVFDPPWSYDAISDEAKLELGLI